MNPEAEIQHYIDACKRFWDQIEVVRNRIDNFLNELLQRPTTLNDLARLEGLHRQQRELFVSHLEVQDRLMAELLAQRALRNDAHDGAAPVA